MTLNELKQTKLWFLWNYAPGKNGKPTKVSMSCAGGKTGTSEEYSNTWTTHAEAVTAQKKYNSSGIGFKIPDDMYFLDVDHVDMDNPQVKLFLERFSSYAEISPSGNGIHIYGLCDSSKLPLVYDEKKKGMTVHIDFYQKNTKAGIELYFGAATNRFATFTENRINDIDFTEGTQASLITLDKDMRKKPKVNYSSKRDGDREPFDIICDLRKQKNGEKFSKLYDEGAWEEVGYPSQSEAEMGLAEIIAFRCGNDPDLIYEIIKGSALYRPKWERDDYRKSTIEGAIANCNGKFHISVMERPPFVKYEPKSHTEYISVPLLAKYVRENMQFILVRDNVNFQ